MGGTRERRPHSASGGLFPVAFLCGLAGVAFLLAMAAFPGGGYDPTMRMLSALGRTEVRMVERPWSHFLFTAGMFISALAVLFAARRARLSGWGAALNAAGLVWIALVPENVSMPLHNCGCWIAAIGGCAMLLRWLRAEPSRAARRGWLVALLLPLASISLGLACHATRLAPFAPWVPTSQKLVILSFAAWLLCLSARGAQRRSRAAAALCLAVPAVLAGWMLARPAGPTPEDILGEAPGSVQEPPVLPLSDDELAGLAWLERVTGAMSVEEEREWWDVGGSQHGIFAKRYSIAFAGYAAAAIGMRGDAEVRARAGRVVGNCFERMLRRDVWRYSQSKGYWGLKPWAPDPCYRENVMYTGHLLHLLAYYELLTGDRRYRREGGGWDFDAVGKDGRKVHYDVERLVEVTVEQMRKGPNGGVTCEPGLMFFACNSHPQVALSVFGRLGMGDWTAEARRWERWALAHYFSTPLGGGAVSLVYHVRSGLMYPSGQDALDGWSLLWYEAWASDRRLAAALWRRVRARLDWSRLESCEDAPGGAGCCDPRPVSPSVACVFLSAAARACGDAATAERLERAVDAKYLRREGGLCYLDLDREWRIGATAMRLIALAERNGSRLRDIADCGTPLALSE
jgi:hypothetical protein